MGTSVFVGGTGVGVPVGEGVKVGGMGVDVAVGGDGVLVSTWASGSTCWGAKSPPALSSIAPASPNMPHNNKTDMTTTISRKPERSLMFILSS
jgi:hypothetical protein